MACEPKGILCCDLRTCILSWAITRLILMILGIPGCVLSFTQFHGPGQLVIASVTLGMCIFWMIIYSILIHGVRRDIPCIFIFHVVLQELEAITVLCFGILLLIDRAMKNHWGVFCLSLLVFTALIALMQWFVYLLISYYLERKRSRNATYVHFKKEGDEDEASAIAETNTADLQA